MNINRKEKPQTCRDKVLSSTTDNYIQITETYYKYGQASVIYAILKYLGKLTMKDLAEWVNMLIDSDEELKEMVDAYIKDFE